MINPERIYQYIWQDKKQGGTLYTHLSAKGKRTENEAIRKITEVL
jgi:pyruvate formate-lyase activating enzyme-like uncharacterized protein